MVGTPVSSHDFATLALILFDDRLKCCNQNPVGCKDFKGNLLRLRKRDSVVRDLYGSGRGTSNGFLQVVSLTVPVDDVRCSKRLEIFLVNSGCNRNDGRESRDAG